MRASSSARVFASLWMRIASPTISRTVMRGFRLEYGSWKMICIRRRSGRSSRCDGWVMSWPSKTTRPNVGSTRRSMRRPSVLLPQPLSPTRPIVSPRRTRSETPSTARTKRAERPNQPDSHGEVLRDALGGRERARAVAPSGPPGRPTPRAAGGAARRRLEEVLRRRSRETSVARQQREQTLRAPTSASGGSSSRHWSMRSGQRSAKRQPGGSARRSGTMPSIVREAPLGSPRGRAPAGCSRAGRACTGASAARRGLAHGRALDDAPRVHDDDVLRVLGDDAEVVRDEQDAHRRAARCSSRSSSRICAWMVTSSAVVGSSATRSFGSHASAIAIITRWRCPPESWCG